MTGLLVTLACAFVWSTGPLLWLLGGILAGTTNVSLLTAYLERLAPDARGNGMAFLFGAGSLTIILSALLLGQVAPNSLVPLSLATTLAAIVAAASWRLLFRETFEQVLEPVLAPFYRIRGHGPGLAIFPRHGPTLVVANHSAWMDPLWLGKVLPRRLTPMMTSSFYDLPVLKWLMVNVVHAIRVQDSEYRREAPELQVAIAALDRGECVVIFPEGRLRRSTEKPLRQFGQGVWHILNERPTTPVVVCWIEGGWGSFMSYWGGPPTKNKRMDWWRPIKVGVSEPEVLPAHILADSRQTRTYLMQACLAARQHLGLAPLSKQASALVDFD
jgi:1-acyl-sn-glycerol-3-phosphate acyltransferase